MARNIFGAHLRMSAGLASALMSEGSPPADSKSGWMPSIAPKERKQKMAPNAAIRAAGAQVRALVKPREDRRDSPRVVADEDAGTCKARIAGAARRCRN